MEGERARPVRLVWLRHRVRPLWKSGKCSLPAGALDMVLGQPEAAAGHRDRVTTSGLRLDGDGTGLRQTNSGRGTVTCRPRLQ